MPFTTSLPVSGGKINHIVSFYRLRSTPWRGQNSLSGQRLQCGERGVHTFYPQVTSRSLIGIQWRRGRTARRAISVWSGDFEENKATRLIVRGRANLLEGLAGADDIDRLRLLFDDLERKESLIELLNLAETGPGVRIFIGSENKLFSLSGSSLIVAPYRDGDDKIVGAVGVIGPTRLNYSRIVPMVDYTAQLMSRLSR